MKKLLCYDDVALIPHWSHLTGRDECDTSVFFQGKKYSMPIILSPMHFITSPNMIYLFWENGLIPTIHRYYKNAQEQYNDLYLGLAGVLSNRDGKIRGDFSRSVNNLQTIVFEDHKDTINQIIQSTYFAVGGIKKHKVWIETLYNDFGIRKFCIDLANGHTDECIRTCEFINSLDKNNKIISGNYSGDISCGFSDIGALRLGIGGGSCCKTSQATGFYYPSFHAVMDFHKSYPEIEVIADGGIRFPGDIAKAMAVGSSVVMCGRMFAGTSASSGRKYNRNKEQTFDNSEKPFYIEYHGMASAEAKVDIMKRGSVEGEDGLVEYEGGTQLKINDIHENLKSALAYCGARNWKEFSENVSIAEVSFNGSIEKSTRLIRK